MSFVSILIAIEGAILSGYIIWMVCSFRASLKRHKRECEAVARQIARMKGEN